MQHQLFEREDVDVWSILKEIEAFDLPSILNKLPIDAGIKHVLRICCHIVLKVINW